MKMVRKKTKMKERNRCQSRQAPTSEKVTTCPIMLKWCSLTLIPRASRPTRLA